MEQSNKTSNKTYNKLMALGIFICIIVVAILALLVSRCLTANNYDNTKLDEISTTNKEANSEAGPKVKLFNGQEIQTITSDLYNKTNNENVSEKYVSDKNYIFLKSSECKDLDTMSIHYGPNKNEELTYDTLNKVIKINKNNKVDVSNTGDENIIELKSSDNKQTVKIIGHEYSKKTKTVSDVIGLEVVNLSNSEVKTTLNNKTISGVNMKDFVKEFGNPEEARVLGNDNAMYIRYKYKAENFDMIAITDTKNIIHRLVVSRKTK